jgi:hypothetical protein
MIWNIEFDTCRQKARWGRTDCQHFSKRSDVMEQKKLGEKSRDEEQKYTKQKKNREEECGVLL